jgi:ATP-dependent exoDNAse (exonuclease V) beta subunit
MLARWLPPSGDLPGLVSAVACETAAREWTDEQLYAIERREGDLLLAAAAGSGKTSVLVERFVRGVLEDGLGVGEILTITFTEKAAAEMRERIRARLYDAGALEQARATEGAAISTIHGFCARVLRAQALSAGIDPAFAVLDEHEARLVADAAFEAALEELAASGPEAVDLIAAYGPASLRAGILGVYRELRSRGEHQPRLPVLPEPPELAPAIEALRQAAQVAAGELGALPDPGVRVAQALARLERLTSALEAEIPWPGELYALELGNGAGALSTPACLAYGEALGQLRDTCELRHARRAHRLLERLLEAYGRHYSQRKRKRSALDFEDLELLAHRLLTGEAELRERYRRRFRRIMVDELQDTNRVQLELIEALAEENVFTVGDAQQSIYGFRHADVELFEALAEQRRREGAHATLQVNFRSSPELLEVLNGAFREVLGDRFVPLVAGRAEPAGAAEGPRVELLVVDKGADWEAEGQAAPWRVAEARALAGRVSELLAGGAAASQIVVLSRAGTDLRTYERALEERGVPTYLIGGRGYWAHPQVLDLVSYLQALSNPAEQEALYTVLSSPLVGVSLDTLVLVGAAAQAAEVEPWAAMLGGDLPGVAPADRERIERFTGWFQAERAAAGGRGLEELIERALEITGYDEHVLALAGGRRRLANLRKLMRLARAHEAAHGPDLRGFLDALAERMRGGGVDARESEAPVEGEALEAVRLMTIHRSKGLEFDIVCVADLGRVRRPSVDVMRVGRDGRFGLRLSEPGSGKAIPALDYRLLGEERQAAEEAEERRLYYVAMTRARERLVLSGAARLDAWPEGNGGTAIGWLGPALVPDLAAHLGEGSGRSELGVGWSLVRASTVPESAAPGSARAAPPPAAAPAPWASPPAAAPAPRLRPPALSYSALTLYRRCGYRFYVERVLALPPAPVPPSPEAPSPLPAARPATERGVIVHALLEQLDFRRPLAPGPEAIAAVCRTRGLSAPEPAEAEELSGLVRGFAAGQLCARLARATQVRREQRFSFLLGDDVLISGALDVVARERAGMLVVDYKSDRLTDATPAKLVQREYGLQQAIYALALLRAGASRVEVAHLFLERPDEPVTETFAAADAPELERRLREVGDRIARREFPVAEEPWRGLCSGCPAEGGLCSWPPALTRRERPDRLF